MKYIIILSFLSINYSLLAQEIETNLTKPELVYMSSDSLKKMDTHFHELVDNKKLAGIQTAIMRSGKLIHFDSYGYADIDQDVLLDENSIFRIFSMTKPIVSIALMQLYEQGKFNLQDPLSKFVSEFDSMYVYTDSGLVTAKNKIKIIHLLTHSAGFSHGQTPYARLNETYSNANLMSYQTNKEFVLALSKLPLQFEPGTDWQYGFSTAICGYLIEILSGKTLDVYLKEKIFSPLKMNDTYFKVPKEKIDQLTVGYRWHKENGLVISEIPENSRYVNNVTLFHGGGGLVSTTLDYLKFCQMILNKGKLNNNQIIKEETVDLILQDHLEEVRRFQSDLEVREGEAGFGLGFAIRGNDENTLEKVFGWGGIAGTYFKIDLEHDLAYVLMIQLYPHGHLNLREKFQNDIEAAIIK